MATQNVKEREENRCKKEREKKERKEGICIKGSLKLEQGLFRMKRKKLDYTNSIMTIDYPFTNTIFDGGTDL